MKQKFIEKMVHLWSVDRTPEQDIELANLEYWFMELI